MQTKYKYMSEEIICGVIYKETISPWGMKAFAINNGKIIGEHISSNEIFAKADLGFDYATDSAEHHKRRHDFYKELFPSGYKMVWLGIKNHEEIEQMLDKPSNALETEAK